jgi:hypothetical protein
MATNSETIFIDNCIDTESIDIIRKFLDNFNKPNVFRGMYRDVDDFFKEIEFNTYLVKYFSRMSKEQKNVSGSGFEEEKKRMNQDCLMYAERLNILAKKKYDKFTTLSRKYQRERYQYKESSAWKVFFQKGTKEEYEKMITGIEPCLYWTMLQFSILISDLEKAQLVSPNSDSKNIETLITLLESLQETPENELQQPLENELQQTPPVSYLQPGDGYGDKTTLLSTDAGGNRRHRRHTHRRHHSTHYHKSVKRSKKGKKIMKSHTRKRHTRARKQNRRRNRSRK